MPRPSVIPEILNRLSKYLDERQAEWLAQPVPDNERNPTLPYTPDFKVNVQGLGKAIGLTPGQYQYLHLRPELTSVVNAVAEQQGLLPIGARKEGTKLQARNEIQDQIALSNRTAQDAAKAAVEARASEQALLDELREAHETIAAQAATIMRLEAQLNEIRNGVWVEVT